MFSGNNNSVVGRRRCILCLKDCSREPVRDNVLKQVQRAAFNKFLSNFLEMDVAKLGVGEALPGSVEEFFTLCQECTDKVKMISECEAIGEMLEALRALHNSVEEALASDGGVDNPVDHPTNANNQLIFRREFHNKCSQRVEEVARILSWLSGTSSPSEEPLDLSMNTRISSRSSSDLPAAPASAPPPQTEGVPRDLLTQGSTSSVPPPTTEEPRCSFENIFPRPCNLQNHRPKEKHPRRHYVPVPPPAPPAQTQGRGERGQRGFATGNWGYSGCGAQASTSATNKGNHNTTPPPPLGIHLGRTASLLLPQPVALVEAVIWRMVSEVSQIGRELLCPYCPARMTRWDSVFTHLLNKHFLLIVEILGGVNSQQQQP